MEGTIPEASQPTPKQERATARAARGFVVIAFIALWMAAGWLWKLGVNEYLLLGVPLTILFQLLVARGSLPAVWVRDAPRLRVNIQWLSVSAALAALPAYELSRLEFPRQWVGGCWLACAVLGALAAAYAIQNYNRKVARTVPRVAGMVVIVSVLMMIGTLAQKGLALGGVGNALLVGLTSTLLYFPVSFFLEEVTFRGTLDAYVYRTEDKGGFGSAVLVAFLWGLWHLPIVPVQDAFLLVAVRLGILHSVVGVPLAMGWRVGGNLLVPAAAHAVLDGVRNTLQALR